MSVTRIFVGLGLLAVMRGIDFEDDFNLTCLRICFLVIQVGLLGALGILYKHIKATGNQTEITVPVQPSFSQPEVSPGETKAVTIEEYDLSQLWALFIKLAMGSVIGFFIHYKWGFAPPLFMQCWLNPFQVVDHQLSKLYFFGQQAKGALARPWKEPSPFAAMMGITPEPTAPATRQELKRQAKEAKKAKKNT